MSIPLKAVRFLRQASPYVAGDVAAFSPDKAEAYLRARLAEPYDLPEPDPAEATKAKQAAK